MNDPLAAFAGRTVDDPYPSYKWLRENAPVYRNPRTGEWLLSRFEDVYDALRNHAVFSSTSLGFPLIGDDPPRHTRLRGLVNRAFTSTMIKKLTPFIESTCHELVDAFEAGEVDVVPSLTVPFPVIVIARMMGISDKDRARFKLWSDALTGLLDGETRGELGSVINEMFPYFASEIARRRTEATDDLIAAVVGAEIDGESLGDEEIIGFCLLLLVAGNETTTNLIGNMLNVMTDRPDLWARLREDRSLVEAAVEETLRFDSPVQYIYRKALSDIEIRGERIAAGDRVLVGFAAANRDPENFEDPDTFSLDRDLKRHLAFGHGIHFCLGAPLARVEGRVVLDALLDRFSGVSRAGPLERLPSHLLRGFHHLPLRFEPA
ncbi:MAG: cytochrome P450 [Pseudomonadales bacterium]|nr:cytochrome P450 [Pseudomonadales bacterium]